MRVNNSIFELELAKPPYYFLSLLELIFFGFVAQRQVGETALNDNSSRSHQIIRLVTFVDLNFFWCFYIKFFLLTSNSRVFTDNWKYSPWKFWLREVLRCNLGKYKNILTFMWSFRLHGWLLDKFNPQNFVDLAGSERASQTHADGARLREGCHINLSLMTLTTVIRKLRSESIHYRILSHGETVYIF